MTMPLQSKQLKNQPEKLSLQRPAPKALEFPRQALMGLEPAATAIHETVQAPYAMCANSVMAAACLAIQGHAEIELPIAGKPKPLSCFFLTIGLSGERKSAADSLASASIEEKERALKEEHESLLPSW